MAGTSGLYRGINWRIIRNSFQNRTGRNLKDKKDGNIFDFSKKEDAGYGIGVPHFCTIESIIKII